MPISDDVFILLLSDYCARAGSSEHGAGLGH